MLSSPLQHVFPPCSSIQTVYISTPAAKTVSPNLAQCVCKVPSTWNVLNPASYWPFRLSLAPLVGCLLSVNSGEQCHVCRNLIEPSKLKLLSRTCDVYFCVSLSYMLSYSFQHLKYPSKRKTFPRKRHDPLAQDSSPLSNEPLSSLLPGSSFLSPATKTQHLCPPLSSRRHFPFFPLRSDAITQRTTQT